VYAHLEVGNLR